MDESALLLSMADRMLWIAALVAVQAATSVNEQTLTFVPKLGAVAFVLVILGASMMALVGDFTQDIFAEIARMGG